MAHVANEKWQEIKQRMRVLGISEADIDEQFVLGSGKGGQKINNSHVVVVLTYQDHQIRCQRSRSRDVNRYFARKWLCEKVSNALGIPTRDQIKIQKAIKQKNRRKKRSAKKYHTE